MQGVRPQIVDLIDRMVNGEPYADAVLPNGEKVKVSEGSETWKATREAERLDDPAIAEELRPVLNDKTKAGPHRAACFIIAKIGLNARNPRCAEILIDRVRSATRPRDLHDALGFLGDIHKPAGTDISPILALLTHKNPSVVRDAIQALSNTDHPEAEDALITLAHTTEDDFIRAPLHAVLAHIGTPRSYAVLEAGARSKIRDTKRSAQFALDTLRARFPAAR
ncbi:MAG: HEAT repeat domain-containing protein [Phycisphaerales bacterium]|nr:HEAT repeat domain-containing protein [Planctomycetota bacterium]MCH8508482.1 HEAT repeat domain-containing protein [Phycisphaerales bacterium]